MNERIQKLAEQASGMSIGQELTIFASGDGVGKSTFLEKFAQLIVAECMEQVRGQYVPVIEDEAMMKDTHWDGYVQCGVDSYVAIREHFYGEEE